MELNKEKFSCTLDIKSSNKSKKKFNITKSSVNGDPILKRRL